MPEQWSAEAQRKIAEIAAKNGFSEEAGLAMADAISRGVGSMAQFNHRDLGGQGQWVRGGMLMIADMFNDGLKARVRNLAETLADAAQRGSIEPTGGGDGAGGSLGWWPAELGQPSSSGTQNGMRYAVFPSARRIAIERGGKVTVYDSGDHRIGGVSQQQGSNSSLRFSSQLGDLGLDALREVRESRSSDGASGQDAPSIRQTEPSGHPPVFAGGGEPGGGEHPSAASPTAPSAARAAIDARTAGKDPLELIRQLAGLRDAGILTDEEFAAKKTELLARL